VRRFIAVLENEQQILISGDADSLLPLAEQKSKLATQLSGLAEQRQQMLTKTESTLTTMAAWLATLSDPAPAAAWQTLLELAGQARELNTLNGKLIAERMRHNQQALAILLSAGGKAALYGPDGQTRMTGGGRPLGSA
jgi:flagella synthesis protein FlgN